MPGRLMTAQQAAKEYGGSCKSIRKHGNEVTLKNGQGRKVTIPKNKEVYHRGGCDFGVYSESTDHARHKRGAKERVGRGSSRHKHD